MKRINILTPKSLDAVGRIIAITRRAKVSVVNMQIAADTTIYRIHMDVNGDPDEVNWLVAKLDKLPEVLTIEEIHINR
ncbi:MAG: ACT domain-containing protein [Pyrobaculum sp.]|jgi:acetolactate synthase II small subunit|uniref:ACT domain-containing protein n=1 Tax=Pyrobaculum sp. 3827-6 TaxID=2983604 RepID=UPI0021D8E8DC|nr:ACT domain-containing protein [Pyrobaculum sp. 3827-6]MCU7787207.1 ACT domain-containing protein [Pyrobaculum sp. 3827-6]